MTVKLPITQEGPHFAFACELEGTSYTFTFRWNGRDGAWYLEIGDGAGLALLSGIKVVINNFFLKALRGPSGAELPPGDFIAIDTTDQELDSGFEDIGRRVQVLYLTRTEIAEASARAQE